MGQLKHYNESTGQWEVTIAGAQGPVGPKGDDGYVGSDGLPGIIAQAGEPSSTEVLWLDLDEDGVGVPLGGTAGQVLSKVDSGDFNTEWSTPLSQSDIDTALQDYYTSAQVDTAFQDYYTSAQIDTTLQSYYTSAQVDTSLQDYYTSTQVDTSLQDYYTITQTDSVISSAVSSVIDTAPAMLDTLNELSAALNDDPNFASTVTAALAALVPAGTINQTARATAPAGYLLCDGSAISRSTYSALFDAIGTAYGTGDGSTTFNIPNLKGKVPVGYDSSQAEFDTLGETGGAKTHTLSSNEMPSHNHTGSTSTNGGHTHDVYGKTYVNTLSWNELMAGRGSLSGSSATSYNGDHAHSFTTNSSGGGAAHNNLQPYVVLNYMIKI